MEAKSDDDEFPLFPLEPFEKMLTFEKSKFKNIIGAKQGDDGVWNYGLENGDLINLNAVGCIMC